jgi:hypothetical protein
MDKKRHKKIKGKEGFAKTKSKTLTKTPERMRQVISDSWQEIDAILHNLGVASGGNPSFLYEAIILPLTLRFAKWYSVDKRRAFFSSHKVRPNHSRKNNSSKRSGLVSKPRNDKARKSENKSGVLRKHL